MTREIIDNGQIVYLDGMDTSEAKRLKAIQHALEHIKENDFEKNNVQEIEFDRHAI